MWRDRDSETYFGIPSSREKPSSSPATWSPVEFLANKMWPNPCEAKFKYLAEHDVPTLRRYVMTAKLGEAHLSIAAEILGRADDEDQTVRAFLLELLRHPSPVVREGAVIGLYYHVARYDDPLLRRIDELRKNDPSPGVRATADEVIEEAEERKHDSELIRDFAA